VFLLLASKPDGFEVDEDNFLPQLSSEGIQLFFLQPGETTSQEGPPPQIDAPVLRQEDTGRAGDSAVKRWPTVFSLPPMPDLEDALTQLRNDASRGANLKCRAQFVNKFLAYIITFVFKEFKSQEDPYLEAVELRDICMSIIQTYPGLRDGSPDGCRFWWIKIIRRMKELRSKIRPECSSPRVLENRQKHGVKRKAEQGNAQEQGQSVKKRLFDSQADQVEEGNAIQEANSIRDDHVEEESNLVIDDEQQLENSAPDDQVSVMAKSVTFGDCEEVSSLHETKRHNLNAHFAALPSEEVLAHMRDLFPERILRCQNLTVVEEIQLYRPLEQSTVILQEAFLMIEEYNRNNGSDYILPASPSAIESGICDALHQVYERRLAFKNFKLCKEFMDPTDDYQQQLATAFCVLLGRLKTNQEIVFNEQLPVSILKCDGTWYGVVINGARFFF
jgi:hypothetical protein